MSDSTIVRFEDESEENGGKRATSSLTEKYFFDSRIVMVTGEISHTLAERVCLSLFALAQASDDPHNRHHFLAWRARGIRGYDSRHN